MLRSLDDSSVFPALSWLASCSLLLNSTSSELVAFRSREVLKGDGGHLKSDFVLNFHSKSQGSHVVA